MNTHSGARGSGEGTRAAARVVTALCAFTGVTATAGGIELIVFRHGASWLPEPATALRHAPFSDYFIPGVLLIGTVGISNVAAAVLTFRRRPQAGVAGLLGGATLSIFVLAEMALLRAASAVELAYLAIGVTTAMVAAFLIRMARDGHAADSPADEGSR